MVPRHHQFLLYIQWNSVSANRSSFMVLKCLTQSKFSFWVWICRSAKLVYSSTRKKVGENVISSYLIYFCKSCAMYWELWSFRKQIQLDYWRRCSVNVVQESRRMLWAPLSLFAGIALLWGILVHKFWWTDQTPFPHQLGLGCRMLYVAGLAFGCDSLGKYLTTFITLCCQ